MKANELLKCTDNYCCRLKGRSLARYLKKSTLCGYSLNTSLTSQISKANSLSIRLKQGSKVCLYAGEQAGKKLNNFITTVISAGSKQTNQHTPDFTVVGKQRNITKEILWAYFPIQFQKLSITFWTLKQTLTYYVVFLQLIALIYFYGEYHLGLNLMYNCV